MFTDLPPGCEQLYVHSLIRNLAKFPEIPYNPSTAVTFRNGDNIVLVSRPTDIMQEFIQAVLLDFQAGVNSVTMDQLPKKHYRDRKLFVKFVN